MIYKFGNLITCEDKINEIFEILKQISPTDTTILITGESGTGKDVMAREIHNHSRRADTPFVVINCAAVPDNLIEAELFGYAKGSFTGATHDFMGKFSQAHGGTLFLDEIGNMSLATQSKVLRVIESRTFELIGSKEAIHTDIRIICATNSDLEREVKLKNFRLDLFHRINEFHIMLPPLRERQGDLHLFIEAFLPEFNEKFGKKVQGISLPALGLLQMQHWDGNIREFRNVIGRAVFNTKGDQIWVEHLPARIITEEGADAGRGGGGASSRLKSGISIPAVFGQDDSKLLSLEEMEKNYILEVLKKFGWNKSRVAKALKIERCTLYNKMKKYSLFKTS